MAARRGRRCGAGIWIGVLVALTASPVLASQAAFANGERLGLGAPQAISVAGRELVLTGQGRKVEHFIVIYGYALYLPASYPLPGAPAGSSGFAFDTGTHTALRVEIVFDHLPEKMPTEWTEALREAVTDTEYGRMHAMYGDLNMSDVVLIDYDPDRGTTVSLNGRAVVETRDHRLMAVLMNIWRH